MSRFSFDLFFRPRSIAVVGASDRAPSVGRTVMQNLLAGGFAGPVLPVNPKHPAVCGVLAYRDVGQLPIAPDLAVICTPPASVPGVLDELGRRGTRAAAVLTAGLERCADQRGRSGQELMLDVARSHGMRVLGPNCLGVISSGSRLNASFACGRPLAGDLAFVTQSGALATAVLDWASSQGIGFSHFVSLGNSADVGFADLLNYLTDDPATRAVLLYIEAVTQAPAFMAAARRASSKKPVVAVKAGRVTEGARAATSHTGALAGADEVYDAAFRRAGVLRVATIESLFNAVETLARAHPLRGDRLAILTNGGGPGVMATDALVSGGGRLAELSPATVKRLDAALPANWSRANPADIIGDASAERYVLALEALLSDPANDAVLVLHAPTALVSSGEIATRIAPAVRHAERPVLTCWLGRDAVADARRTFAAQRIPSYESPEDAVQAFLQMVRFKRVQAIAAEDLDARQVEDDADLATARALVATALAAGREWLTEPEAKELLQCFGIPIVATRTAASAADAGRIASEIGFPVALKILSRDVIHKTDVGGVALNLTDAKAVAAAAERMLEQVHTNQPWAHIEGFTVQPMVRRPQAQELILGIGNDRTFGPVILFGQGGTAAEVIADKAVDLPPLSRQRAVELVSRTRVAKLLQGYRDRAPAALQDLVSALVQMARLAGALPEVAELDINPLLADDEGVVALDARVRVAAAGRNVPPAISRAKAAHGSTAAAAR